MQDKGNNSCRLKVHVNNTPRPASNIKYERDGSCPVVQVTSSGHQVEAKKQCYSLGPEKENLELRSCAVTKPDVRCEKFLDDWTSKGG